MLPMLPLLLLLECVTILKNKYMCFRRSLSPREDYACWWQVFCFPLRAVEFKRDVGDGYEKKK
ncbi:hypothetical protein CVD27_15390 [Neobacillus cucumis]|uniref:Uncharacterized protein n=1 Tax=Neobacillus cucumis TaxID=1740721 RepID=A0A2N5HCW4_9BACI|nr:hypothetical protein CVD27_15390 [Neobacillus cucumis]